MNRVQMKDLHNLTVRDKIKVVQTLWDDIVNEQSINTLPAEHKRILDNRINLINSGNAKFKSWSEVKTKFQSIL